MTELLLPDDVPSVLLGCEFSRNGIGRSGNSVFRVETPDQRSLIVKLFEPARADTALQEYTRLNWLGEVGVSAPRAHGIYETTSHHWLIMERLPGLNAVISDDPAHRKMEAVAHALAELHALDPGLCPYDETISVKIANAQENLGDGAVDELDFDEDHSNMTAAQLFDELVKLRPASEDVVVVHGDASLPNLLLNEGQFSGFIDCGKVGLSDRYQDIAICCRSIRRNLGDVWIEPFLRAYGLTSVDHRRMRFYRMLDEFF